MVREIVFYPDPRLYEVSAPVFPGTFPYRGQSALEIEQDLKDTLTYTKGVAIAGIQIGLPLRVMLVGDTVYWNPVEVARCRCGDVVDEGCLSVPGFLERVFRPCNVHLAYRDSAGVEHEVKLDGLSAQAALHEIEHMDGKLLTSAMTPVTIEKLHKQMKRIRRTAKARGVSLTEQVYGAGK